MGATACYLMELLETESKTPKFYVFDLFNIIPHPVDGEELVGNTPWGEDINAWFNRIGGKHKLLDAFDFYIENSPARKYLTNRAQFTSWQASGEFEDNSVLFCLIRASENYKHATNDISDWFKKIKVGGKLVFTEANKEAKQAILDYCNRNGFSGKYDGSAIIIYK